MFATTSARDRLVVPIIGIFLLLCYNWMYGAFYPASNGNIGHDFAYYLSRLLDGYYWFLNNGPFEPHWFTPSFCGGVPAFANPQDMYYSVPQWLTFISQPLTAVYATHIIFAVIGFVGFYALLRLSFQTSKWTALLGATLFLFNGFYGYRMVVGHISFHSFMLAPLVTFLLLQNPGRVEAPVALERLRSLLFVTFAAVLMSYTVYSAGLYQTVPVGLFIMFAGIIHGQWYGGRINFWLMLSATTILSVILSWPKLGPAFSFLAQYDRSSYLLPGVDSVWGLLVLTFQTVFLRPEGTTGREFLTNAQWNIGQHELEYGVTIVPFILIAIGAAFYIFKRVQEKSFSLTPTKVISIAVVILIIALPMALNYYSIWWNSVLKETPFLRNSSTLIRWFCLYVPVVVLAAALCFEKTKWFEKFRFHLAVTGIAVVVLTNLSAGNELYHNQNYPPKYVTQGYSIAQERGVPPAIRDIYVFKDAQGKVRRPPFKNDALVSGGSQLYCYEAIFGYRLEYFPREPLQVGRIDKIIDGHYNIKNPACYVYPEENSCKPGSHFSVEERDKAVAFASHKPFEFKIPSHQAWLNVLSAFVSIAFVIFWICYPLLRSRYAAKH